MAWDAYCKSMNQYGAQMAGVFAHDGTKWGSHDMDNATKEEMSGVYKSLSTGSYDGVSINGIKAVVTHCEKGSFLIAKAKAKEGVADNERPLFYVMLGNTCFTVASTSQKASKSGNEREIVQIIETHFSDLKNC